MAGVKDIKRRRKSIENTMKITKAMELVAFSKLKKNREQVKKTSPFFDKIYETINDIACVSRDKDSIFLNQRNIKKRCYIVISGDKGLAGNYNGNILRFAQNEVNKYHKEEILVIPIGKKTLDFFKKQNYDIYKQYSNVFEIFDIDLARDISKLIIDGFINGRFQEVYVVFTNFVSVLIGRPNIKKILPLSISSFESNVKFKNIIYDPSPGVVFNMIIPQYVTGVIYGAVIESIASEQGARRVAMEAASKNAKEMLHDIDLIFNKTRQSKITQEITEIVSGINEF